MLEIITQSLVGRFIHHCGVLELITNNAVGQLSLDSILAAEATRASFARRIAMLRCLLMGAGSGLLSWGIFRNRIQRVAHEATASPILGHFGNSRSWLEFLMRNGAAMRPRFSMLQ